MSYRDIQVDIRGDGVAHLSLNRPAKRNAMNAAMLEELHAFAEDKATLGGLRAVVLTGTGDVFCAGGDLDWMRAQVNADRATRMAEARKLAHALRASNPDRHRHKRHRPCP